MSTIHSSLKGRALKIKINSSSTFLQDFDLARTCLLSCKEGTDLTLCLETKKDKEFDQVIEWNINHFDINVNLVRI